MILWSFLPIGFSYTIEMYWTHLFAKSQSQTQPPAWISPQNLGFLNPMSAHFFRLTCHDKCNGYGGWSCLAWKIHDICGWRIENSGSGWSGCSWIKLSQRTFNHDPCDTESQGKYQGRLYMSHFSYSCKFGLKTCCLPPNFRTSAT